MPHVYIGQISPLCHLIAYIVIAVHPPYPVLVIIFMLAGFGNGLADAAWNAWIGNMANPNEVLGFLHAFYGVGAVLAPLIATTMITKGDRLPWYYFYYVMVNLHLLPSPLSWPATNVYRQDWHGHNRARNLSNRLLERRRRHVPRSESSNWRQQGQSHERSTYPPSLRTRHLDLRHLSAGLCWH